MDGHGRTAAIRGPRPATVLLVDGGCALCGRLTRLVLALDRRRRFRFAALQSAWADAVLARHGAEAAADDPRTFLALVDRGTPDERLLVRSAAALRVARELGGPWRALAVARLLPRAWRDGLYDLVARHRRALARGACPLPRAAEAWRFLDARDAEEEPA
jgi:predicted DCC family thiol-disulfide oxidoreductase YuxK